MAEREPKHNQSEIYQMLLNNPEEEIPINYHSHKEQNVYDNSERLIRALERHISFLEEEVRRKDEIILL